MDADEGSREGCGVVVLMPDEGKLDSLASVLLTILIDHGGEGMTAEEVAVEGERHDEHMLDRQEVALALGILLDGDLAVCNEDGRWRPTKAAIEAKRLPD